MQLTCVWCLKSRSNKYQLILVVLAGWSNKWSGWRCEPHEYKYVYLQNRDLIICPALSTPWATFRWWGSSSSCSVFNVRTFSSLIIQFQCVGVSVCVSIFMPSLCPVSTVYEPLTGTASWSIIHVNSATSSYSFHNRTHPPACISLLCTAVLKQMHSMIFR